MGNTESQPAKFAAFLGQYQKREEVEDDRFGRVTIYNQEHNPTDLIMVKEKWTNTPGDAFALETNIGSRVHNNHKNLAK